MASPLLLGKCPACKGPRKYTTDLRKRLWLRCPSPVCTSHPEKVKRGAPASKIVSSSKIVSLNEARRARASRGVR
jgi:hypothetical protein